MKYLKMIFNWFIRLFSNPEQLTKTYPDFAQKEPTVPEKLKLSETDKMICFYRLLAAHKKANETDRFLEDVAREDPKIAFMFEDTKEHLPRTDHS